MGQEAPDFELPDQDDKEIRLSDYRDERNVILIVNPGKLNDSCKDYLLFYKEHIADFSATHTQLLGVNMEKSSVNQKWIEGIGGLGFPLLSDFAPLGDITLKYDCFVPSEGYGKRVLFLIDKQGFIRHIEVLSGEPGACPNMANLLDATKLLE